MIELRDVLINNTGGVSVAVVAVVVVLSRCVEVVGLDGGASD